MAVHYDALARDLTRMPKAYASRVRCGADSKWLTAPAARLRFFSGLISSCMSRSVEDKASA
jgi:hypothetical protein